jgi:carboxyl-terminal processing protease
LLQPGVGYIRIANFTSTTAEELDQAIEELTRQGMVRLMLDLRGNPGGLLEQAVQVAERFIPAGELIVYTRGRIRGSNQDYVAKRGVERWDQPLILLVDGSSASASEIVSGAVQDHDRGLIVGETTFGKGLVQRVMPLRQGGGALAVTTAKYYTPKGRLIQRDYTDFDEYYMHRDEDPPQGEADRSDDGATREVFYTSGGRKVYGGGGIRPDHIVESTRAPKILYQLLRENLIFDFAVRHVNSRDDIEPGFEIDETLMAAFRTFLGDREFEFDEQDFAEHRETLALRLQAQIARLLWGQEAESKVLTSADPQVQRALDLFDEAAELSRHGTPREADKLHAEAAPEPL